ncbi:uncharacterized protein BDV17DRAFT_264801 [Aspergillus undulatus]|uniref:uncharacterized protein n=1 Tax=Aspergillus undulatus TaxID=1810928 RepID=UPI003CCE3047
MALNDRMDMWHQRIDADEKAMNYDGLETPTEAEDMNADKVDLDKMEFDKTDANQTSFSKDFITSTPIYSWLIKNLEREICLSRSEDGIQKVISEAVLERLPTTRRMSRKESPQVYQMTISLQWRLLNFLRDQDYDETIDNLS